MIGNLGSIPLCIQAQSFSDLLVCLDYSPALPHAVLYFVFTVYVQVPEKPVGLST